jgi:hypothetical protein
VNSNFTTSVQKKGGHFFSSLCVQAAATDALIHLSKALNIREICTFRWYSALLVTVHLKWYILVVVCTIKFIVGQTRLSPNNSIFE